MNPLTQEWIDKAEGDFATALRERRARVRPNFDSACFHTQQCAEKYLKARLQEALIGIPRTHDLIVLLNLVLTIEPSWDTLQSDLLTLNTYGVAVRYPGASADRLMAREAVRCCQNVRQTIRTSFGLL